MACVCFVGLTCCTSFDILFNVLLHTRPPEIAFCQLVHIWNSRVSSGGCVVKELNYPPLQIVVTGNNNTIVLPPCWCDFYQLVGVGPVLDSFMAFFVFPLVFFYHFLDCLILVRIYSCHISLPFSFVMWVCFFASREPCIYFAKEFWGYDHRILVIFSLTVVRTSW